MTLLNDLVVQNNNELQKYMKSNELEAVVITNENNIAYYTGAKTHGIYYVNENNEKKLYVPLMEYWKTIKHVHSMIEVYPVTKIIYNEKDPPHQINKSFEEIIDEILATHNRIGIEKNLHQKNDVKKKLEEKNPIIITDYIIENRRKKKTIEIEFIKKATIITEEALEETINTITPGMKEREIYILLLQKLYEKGAEHLGFDPIVAINENASNPHATPGDKKLGSQSLILIDVGGGYSNYTSDMTRTILYGNSNLRTFLDNLEDAFNEALEKCYPGNKVMEIDLAARRRLGIRRLERYFIHSLGHGVGIEVHEKPIISPLSKEELITNDIITIEPGIYFPDKLGFRIENLVLITDNGPKILNKLPLQL